MILVRFMVILMVAALLLTACSDDDNPTSSSDGAITLRYTSDNYTVGDSVEVIITNSSSDTAFCSGCYPKFLVLGYCRGDTGWVAMTGLSLYCPTIGNGYWPIAPGESYPANFYWPLDSAGLYRFESRLILFEDSVWVKSIYTDPIRVR